MKNFLTKNKIYLVGILCGVLLVFVFSELTTQKRLSNFNQTLDQQIAEHLKELSALAMAIGQATGNDEANSLFPTCPSGENSEYENLLSRLDSGLSQTELSRLEVVFANCAGVVAGRRLSLAYQLDRHTQALADFVMLEVANKAKTIDLEQLAKWQELAATEQKIGRELSEVTVLQKQIILALKSGLAKESEEVDGLRVDAHNLLAVMAEDIAVAAELRAELIKE